MNELERNYMRRQLQHHGILGQKWGKRNGPPYPLGASQHSASEKKAGWRKSLDKSKDEYHTKSNHNRYVEAGKSAVSAMSGRLAGSINDESIQIGKRAVDKLFRRKTGSDYGGTHNLPEDLLGEKVTEPLNSNQSIIGRNPGGYRDNCKDVSLTACYAHLGYGDLKANAKSFKGNLTDFMEDRFENAEVNHLTADSSNVQERLNRQILKKCSEGDTGIVGISYDPKFLKANAAEDGHAFNFFVEDGRVLFKDAQPEQPLEDASKWFKALDAGKEVEWVKIDETLIPKADALEKSMSKL